jgi:tight adherence protein C
MFWTIAGAVFIAIFFFTYGLAISWTSWKRVKVRASSPGSMPIPALLRSQEKASGFKKWSMEWLAYSGQWALPNLDKVSEMRKTLIQAGYRHPKAPAVYMGLRVVAAFALTLPLLLFFVVRGKLAPANLVIAFSLSLVGFHLPAFLLGVKVKRRQERLDRALPDILDMFVIAMDAGLSLNAALQRVAEEIRGVFHDFYEELQIATAELRTGITWDEAFDNLAQRTGVQSIRSMVTLMTQTGKLGGSIGDALRNHSEFTRTQRLLRAEERAAKLPVKMVIPMLFCIFPAIIIVVVGPGLINIYDKLIKSGLLSGASQGFGVGGF